MKQAIGWTIAIAILGGIGAGIEIAHRAAQKEPTEEHEEKGHVSRNDHGDIVVTADPQLCELIGLRIEELRPVTHRPQLTAYGSLQEDPALSFTLRAPLAGIIRGGSWPTLGATLADGAAIGEIAPRFSPAERVDIASRLAAAKADGLAATASAAAAKAALDRARQLNADKTVSDRALQDAEVRWSAEDSRLAAAKETVAMLESALDRQAPLPLRIDRGGEVVEVFAQAGEAVESGTPILRVARFTSLLARVEVPAGDRCPPDVATAQVAVAGQLLKAERVALTSGARGQAFFFRISDEKLGLRPGVAVTAHLELPGEPLKGVVIPRSAVVRFGGKPWVYVKGEGDAFIRREIPLDAPTDTGWFVPWGEQTVSIADEGVQMLLSEELKSQIAAER